MIRSLALLVFLVASSNLWCASRAAAAEVANSVVKVFSTMRLPDPVKPWTKQAPIEATGSGVVIEGQRILTNAHVVLYASQVQVQANEAGDKVSATVVAVAPGIDLAVLKLDDESFFDTHPPLARASKLPQIKDAVLAYGFPTGGTSLSITKGIVSRIEFVPYNFPVSGLRIQVDAAINPGNSGGPAVAGRQDDRPRLQQAERRRGEHRLHHPERGGRAVPEGHRRRPLRRQAGDVRRPADAREPGPARLPEARQGGGGMVVHKPYVSDDAYPLKKWDVITRIGDAPIDNQGMVRLGRDLRVSFHYLIQKTAHDGVLPLTVVRGSQTLQIRLPVTTERPTLITDLNGGYPSYFVYGPLVFSRATWQFLAAHGQTAGRRA
jgi:hypothetical protein